MGFQEYAGPPGPAPENQGDEFPKTSQALRGPRWSRGRDRGADPHAFFPSREEPNLSLQGSCRELLVRAPLPPATKMAAAGVEQGGSHWEGAELPRPKFRSHQDWMARVQLGLCRICVAVPALFGRGSPSGVAEERGKEREKKRKGSVNNNFRAGQPLPALLRKPRGTFRALRGGAGERVGNRVGAA